MDAAIRTHYEQVLGHVYVNPLERCNLRCKICYTRKTDPILKESEILGFIHRYKQVHPVSVVTFCGGEVFALPYFTRLVNALSKQGILIQIITNGTIDKLSEFHEPNSINLIVSIDGLRKYHDKNRGKGNFTKSLKFLRKAGEMGFHSEIFSIVTKQNYPDIGLFEQYLHKTLNQNISVTYHPRKPPAYLLHHPVSNIFGDINGFDFVSHEEMHDLFRNRKTFPPKELGCYQIALASDGKVYGCCEGTIPLGQMDDDIQLLLKKLKDRLVIWNSAKAPKHCLGCSQPDFVCGIKRYIS